MTWEPYVEHYLMSLNDIYEPLSGTWGFTNQDNEGHPMTLR